MCILHTNQLKWNSTGVGRDGYWRGYQTQRAEEEAGGRVGGGSYLKYFTLNITTWIPLLSLSIGVQLSGEIDIQSLHTKNEGEKSEEHACRLEFPMSKFSVKFN